jgi:hypothetical protein
MPARATAAEKARRRVLAGARNPHGQNLGGSKVPEALNPRRAETFNEAYLRFRDLLSAYEIDPRSDDAWQELSLNLLATFIPAFRIESSRSPRLHETRDSEFLDAVECLRRDRPDLSIAGGERVVFKSTRPLGPGGKAAKLPAMVKMAQRRGKNWTYVNSEMSRAADREEVAAILRRVVLFISDPESLAHDQSLTVDIPTVE